MSNYNKIIPTLAGSNLLVEAIKSKKPLIFTRIALGDGTLTESESIENLTALKHPMAQNTVQAINSRGNGEIDVVATISNASVTSGFYARELGVFAKVGDTGTEKLFAYTNAGAQASYTPAGTSLDEKLITVTFYIGNDVNVKINLNSQLYITQAALDAHNSATNAHQDAFNKKLDVTSNQYAKAIAKHNQGLQVIKGDNSQEVINFITSNYSDNDINKVLNLSTLKSMLGQGAIVASKLDANAGFVKFANGFTIQWGAFTNVPIGGTISFPVSFDRECYVVVGNDMNGNNVDNQVHSFREHTRTGVKVYSQAAKDGVNKTTAWGRFITVGN
nr:MAG TPA: tail-collar fiber protein [Caudoviricetes sp.]